MNELQAIVEAHQKARGRGELAVLATVVNTVGSAYRRPGAKMLITEMGDTCGSISGGCLERDVIERAREVMRSGVSAIAEYDTRGSEDIVWGFGLGCNGVVQVLLESVAEGSSGDLALKFAGECLRKRERGVLATVIHEEILRGPHVVDVPGHTDNRIPAVGDRVMLDQETIKTSGNLVGSDGDLGEQILEDAQKVLAGHDESDDINFFSYETNGGRTEVFMDVITPPRNLIIFGAERDAEPVVNLAHTLGWRITLVDTRARKATAERFSQADIIVLCRAEEVSNRVALTPDTAVVVMTHNYLDDLALLRHLLYAEIPYLGLLGPKLRASRLVEEIIKDDVNLTHAQIDRLHAPIGMDIGAETAEEIALSIMSEIKATIASRSGGFLRNLDLPIHEPSSHKRSLKDFEAASAKESYSSFRQSEKPEVAAPGFQRTS